ncbi:lariat debranching enzyme [Drosophila guanche]|uniref:Blast:Lariat debranching enzyme n=1 Tax=Drosophila guanche TaxID=7266 RepID=A0A3B0JYQ8_DROGU|nr:lariat debranching enzyme [Drosophila guanche]SPP87184.1 blast:Lariat debranching enzyme [Drosophila guanche]
MKIAIEGCAHGELDRIYDTIACIEKESNTKIDLLLCCGDFQSTRNLEDLQTMAVPKKYLDICTFYKYYSGECVAPVLTIFIGGNHEASNYLQELPYGGWVAPNIYYLGYAGVVNVNGVRIAGISGIFKGHDFLRGHHEFPPYTESTCRSVYHVRQLEVFRLKQLSGKIDIFLSHDWPTGIYEYGNKAQLLRKKPYFAADMESGQLGSRPLEELLKVVQPSYWFAAHLHCKFAALVPHCSSKVPSKGGDGASSSSSSSESEDEAEGSTRASRLPPKPVAVTKFLALDKCLPRRAFLQVLDIPSESTEGARPTFEYDAEWLAILQSTNHLISVKENYYYLPGKKAGAITERFDFTPTDEELSALSAKFQSLTIPENFQRTVPAFDPQQQRNYKHQAVGQPKAQLNPQSNEFCAVLGVDDPLCLALLANGKDLPEVAVADVAKKPEETIELEAEEPIGESACSPPPTEPTELVAPIKRKLNLSLPAPTVTAVKDDNVIELPEEDEQEVAHAETTVEEAIPQPAPGSPPSIKKLKRRNQNIYQAADDE